VGNKVMWTPNRTVSALDLYIQDEDGAFWNGSGFEAETPANWTTYPVAFTEPPSGGCGWIAEFPRDIPAGTYVLTVRERRGSAGAVSDPIEANGDVVVAAEKGFDIESVGD
jgi:hypothetical protein